MRARTAPEVDVEQRGITVAVADPLDHRSQLPATDLNHLPSGPNAGRLGGRTGIDARDDRLAPQHSHVDSGFADPGRIISSFRPVVAYLVVEDRGDDCKMGLAQARQHLVHEISGLGGRLCVLDLGPELPVDRLPVEATERRVPVLFLDGPPDVLKGLDVELVRVLGRDKGEAETKRGEKPKSRLPAHDRPFVHMKFRHVY
jgi:hypothetical protein